MSHGDRVTRLRRASRWWPCRRARRSRPSPTRGAGSTPCSSIPRWRTPPRGAALIGNFVRRIAGLPGDWSMAHFKSSEIAKIRAQVGKGRVDLRALGRRRLRGGRGADPRGDRRPASPASSWTTACSGRTRPRRCVSLFRGHYNIPLVHVDAERAVPRRRWRARPTRRPSARPSAASSSTCSRRRRRKLGGAEFLAQGTLYPDVIESVSFTGGPSVTIKSHHNVGGLPERMSLKLVEPLRELFKDEVRALGRELGLPETFIWRHPFPGPGLAIRVPGRGARPRTWRCCARPTPSSSRRSARPKLYDKIWQAFAVLLPVRTVGVMGDARTYDKVCALRAVTSTDGMTADFFELPARGARPHRDAHHQRGARHQPRGVRRYVEAAGDD